MNFGLLKTEMTIKATTLFEMTFHCKGKRGTELPRRIALLSLLLIYKKLVSLHTEIASLYIEEK